MQLNQKSKQTFMRLRSKSFLLIGALVLALASGKLPAEVKPNGLFGNGAVLQRGVEVPIWGAAREGEKVTVTFQGQEVSTIARNGRWLIKLKSLKAGGPFTLKITGDNQITFTNVLVGEVWLCSGQSNMGFKLNRAANASEAIAAANDPQLRLFTVPHDATDAPKSDIAGEWEESASATASNFSAVAYFFGRDLRRALKVPIGLIDSSVGGTPAEAWTSRYTLEADPALRPILERYAENVKNYKAAAPEAQGNGKAKKGKAAGAPKDVSKSAQRPCGLYNAMIAPLQPYALAGAIWYQGEANSGRAAEYQKLFPAMIGNWRQTWKILPFLFVQIAPEIRMTPEIREAQLLTWKKVPRTAMAVITDIGEANDIHPKKKEPVGARLALAARAIVYKEKLEYSGPVFERMRVRGTEIELSFDHVGSGLKVEGDSLKGFAVAGKDGNFVPAEARIKGDKVIVSAPSVTRPVAVRYGWANVPEINLFNREGLPATPFRTDLPKSERQK
jgi:sialate O-acetylesterase